METRNAPHPSLAQRAAIGLLVLILLILAGLRSAHAVEIVPAVGISSRADAEENPVFLGLGLRTGVLPRVETEFQVAYRKEEAPNGMFDVRTIPVTLSLWVTPLPMVYAGGGAGAYVQAVTYDESLLVPNESATQWGAHLGGGLRFPLAPVAKLDLNGRYVFLKEDADLGGGGFDPSFWSASLGLAIGF